MHPANLTKNLILIQASFTEVLPIWRDYLWPGRVSAIEPSNPITHKGDYDLSLMHAEVFFYKAVINDQIIGVVSGIKTSDQHVRVRGIYVFEQWRRHKIGQRLLKAVIGRAQSLGCSIVWSLPRKEADAFYLANQFKPKGEWFENEMEFGAHRYVEKTIGGKLDKKGPSLI